MNIHLIFESFDSDTLNGALGISDDRRDELKSIAVSAVTGTSNKGDAYARISTQIDTPQELCAAIDYALQLLDNPLITIARLMKMRNSECDCPKCRAKRKQEQVDKEAGHN